MRINSKEELQSKKAEIEQNIQSFTCRVLVCSGTGCMASGAQKIYDEMVRLCEGIDGVEIEMQKDIPHVGVIKTGCQGLCELGPLVRIEPYGYQYVHVQEEDCLEIVERTVRLGHPVDRLFYRPEEWHGKKVPEVLMSGHHANIEKWRREQSIIRTARRRPDLLKKADLTNKEWNFVRQLKKQWKEEESKDENI